jgi:hypothetical protein
MIRLRAATAVIIVMSAGASLVAGTASAGARDRFSDPYSIMAPEPWLAPKYQSPPGLPQRPRAARPRPHRSPTVTVAPTPPPVIVPNGPVVQSLPPVNHGIVPGGGRETFSDRAVRCTHQGALYGVPGSQQGSYMSSCLGQ